MGGGVLFRLIWNKFLNQPLASLVLFIIIITKILEKGNFLFSSTLLSRELNKENKTLAVTMALPESVTQENGVNWNDYSKILV
jgi:hypothetical protein